MSFVAWCACHAADCRARLDAWEQQFLRRQFAREAQAAEAARRAVLARWISQLSLDVREWRTEA